MSDEVYRLLKNSAIELIERLRAFPAREFENESQRRGDGEVGLMLWAAHLEVIPDPPQPTSTPASDPSKPTG